MSELDLSKTPMYDQMRRDGAKALQRTLMGAHGQIIDGDIQRDLDQLMKDAAKGIHLGGGQFKETVGLVRLVGYMQELSRLFGMVPAFGFKFQTDELGRFSMSFDPRVFEQMARGAESGDVKGALNGLASSLGDLHKSMNAVAGLDQARRLPTQSEKGHGHAI